MIAIPDKVADAIRTHAAQCQPRECCGVLLIFKGRLMYRPCRNISVEREDFALHPADLLDAEDHGEVVAYVHSHVGKPPVPTPGDKVMIEKNRLPWVIVNWPLGTMAQYEPVGYEAPLYGRPWVHAVLDCYTFMQDYFKRTLDISLRDYERPEMWWQRRAESGAHKFNLYRENFAKEGFVVLPGDEPWQLHDVMLMMNGQDENGRSVEVENHAAIMVGDNIIGHHFFKRLSSRDVYGDYWHHITTCRLRHASLLK